MGERLEYPLCVHGFCLAFSFPIFPVERYKIENYRQPVPAQPPAQDLEQLPRAQLPVWGRISFELVPEPCPCQGSLTPRGVWGLISHPQQDQSPNPRGAGPAAFAASLWRSRATGEQRQTSSPNPAALALAGRGPARLLGVTFQGLNLCQTRELWP